MHKFLPATRFLDHLNHMYFNGQLDLDKKAFLGNRFRLGILNGDGDVTYPSGARRKPKGYPSFLRKEKAKRREEGREEMGQEEGRGGTVEVNYLGPRSVNRMQVRWRGWGSGVGGGGWGSGKVGEGWSEGESRRKWEGWSGREKERERESRSKGE